MASASRTRERKPVGAGRGSTSRSALCVETQGREILAGIVNDVVTEAMRLGVDAGPASPIEKSNGAFRRRRTDR